MMVAQKRVFTGADGSRSAEPPRSDTIMVLRDVMISMRDGVRLATDVYLPGGAISDCDASARFPVILERTPYGKNEHSRSERTARDSNVRSREQVAEYFVRRGYVVVYQDCRGRNRSEGKFIKYVSEADDGYDTCRWLVAQTWCNGRIGTMGLSYAAHTQAALGCVNAPGVTAMFLDSGGFSNAYQGGIRQGGAFELKQATWAFNKGLISTEVQGDPARRRAMQSIDIKDWFGRLAQWRRGDSPLSLAPEYEEYWFEQRDNSSFSDYWRQLGLYAQGYYDQFCDAAMVHMSSWYDPYSRTATENYMGLSRRKRGPVHLILGPWTHGNRSVTYAGNVDFGSAATIDGNLAPDFLELRARWFDRWLKSDESSEDEGPKVLLFRMGGGSGSKNGEGRLDHGGQWFGAADWPLPETSWVPFYLRANGLLSRVEPSEPSASLGYDYDPGKPVPTIGGAITSGEPVMTGGAFDQREAPEFFGSQPPFRPLADRADVLVFQTPPLEADIEITGPISAELWVSSSCPDTDFTIKLIDVYPPSQDYPEGYAMNLTDGILRVRYRDSWESPEPMIPGEVYRIKVDAFPTSNLFKQGHRIRIDISSSNFPRFDVNPNTGEFDTDSSAVRIAHNRVFLHQTHRSHVILPVIPNRAGRNE